jgi:hypothetical protein
VRRDDPADLELEAVGILRVERLGGGVVGGADQRARLLQPNRDLLQVAERLDLPGDVVQPDGPASGVRFGGVRSDREQGQVVIVGRVRRLEELRAGHLADHPEPKQVPVEGERPVSIAHVEHRVVHSLDGHAATIPHRRPADSAHPVLTGDTVREGFL